MAAAINSYSSAGKGGTSGYGQKATKTVANSPRVVKQNAKGVWQELPAHFGNVAEAAKEFIRKVCDSEMQRIETQRAVDQAQQKALSGVMDTVGNWWKENGATFMRGVGVTVIGALAVTTAIAALPAVAFFGTAGAIVTFGTLAVGTFTTTMGVQDMAAAVIPYQPLKDIVNSPTYTAIENVATAGSMIGTGMTSPIAAMGQMVSKGATQQATEKAENTDYQYNMAEKPGPLADIDARAAGTFSGGKYNVVTLPEDTILYRAGDSAGSPLGQYFTSEPVSSAAQARIDLAIKPQWINPSTGELAGTSYIDTVFSVGIPQGTTVYVGPAGYQGGIYLGGGEQIFIPKPWEIEGVKIISSTPLG